MEYVCTGRIGSDIAAKACKERKNERTRAIFVLRMMVFAPQFSPMEWVLVVAMIVLGIGIALAVLLTVAMTQRLENAGALPSASAKAGPDFIASSILFHIALRGGASVQQAARVVREAGLAAQLVE